jgi:uncharacterized damage-inducible protein DinB
VYRARPVYRAAMTTTPLLDAFRHHAWATDRLLEVCADLSDEQLATTVPGTYGSILETLRHLVGADASYLHLLTDGAVPALEDAEEAALDLAGMRTLAAGFASAFDSVATSDRDGAEDVVRYRDDGTSSHAPYGVRVAQILHHGTDHRSQVCTALTSLGIEPPEIDVWAYAETEGRSWVEGEPAE